MFEPGQFVLWFVECEPECAEVRVVTRVEDGVAYITKYEADDPHNFSLADESPCYYDALTGVELDPVFMRPLVSQILPGVGGILEELDG